jgi:hypothetical protein
LKRLVPSEPVFELQVGAGATGFERLREIGGVRSLTHHTHAGSGAVELRVIVDEDQTIGEVLGLLKALGHPVLHLTKMEPTLETVFIHVVGRGLSDEEPVEAGVSAER